MIIDAYSHVCPEPLLDAIGERHPSDEVAALRKNSYLFDGERRLRYMDRIGVDQQALVLVRPPMWLGMPRPVVHELTRVANTSIAEMAGRWARPVRPGRRAAGGRRRDDGRVRPDEERARNPRRADFLQHRRAAAR